MWISGISIKGSLKALKRAQIMEPSTINYKSTAQVVRYLRKSTMNYSSLRTLEVHLRIAKTGDCRSVQILLESAGPPSVSNSVYLWYLKNTVSNA